MAFSNPQVPLESLPAFAEVEFLELDPRYARVVLGVALAFLIPALLFFEILIFAGLLRNAGTSLLAALGIGLFVLVGLVTLAWYVHKSARVMRYAIREHDVIVRSGVFWRKETVQPISRIQHVTQHQGPVDKRFGLYELKLFSAGTGHFTFRIPGLDEDAATRIRQFILKAQQDGWGDDQAAPDSFLTDTTELPQDRHD